jgi:hypothetical protein
MGIGGDFGGVGDYEPLLFSHYDDAAPPNARARCVAIIATTDVLGAGLLTRRRWPVTETAGQQALCKYSFIA